MSALRAFRFQKSRPAVSSPSSTTSEALPSSPASGNSAPIASQPSESPSSRNGNGNHDSDSEDVIKPPAKRMRILSDSESNHEASPLNNGYGFGGMPSPDVVQSRLDLLQKSFPNKDRMDLQDALKSSSWNVASAMAKLRSDIKSISLPMSAKFANLPKKHR